MLLLFASCAQRADQLLNDLLARTNEIMRRTLEGGGRANATATSGAGASKKKKAAEGGRRKTEREEDEELLGELQQQDATLPVRRRIKRSGDRETVNDG